MTSLELFLSNLKKCCVNLCSACSKHYQYSFPASDTVRGWIFWPCVYCRCSMTKLLSTSSPTSFINIKQFVRVYSLRRQPTQSWFRQSTKLSFRQTVQVTIAKTLWTFKSTYDRTSDVHTFLVSDSLQQIFTNLKILSFFRMFFSVRLLCDI